MELEELYNLGEVELSRMLWDLDVLRDSNLVGRILSLGVQVDLCDHYGNTILHYAARYGNPEVCRMLIESGAKVNSQDGYFRYTPLHVAAREGHLEVCKMLVGAGADVNIQDRYGWTPLKWGMIYQRGAMMPSDQQAQKRYHDIATYLQSVDIYKPKKTGVYDGTT